MRHFDLAKDEAIILSFEDVERGTASGRKSSILQATKEQGDLALTNCRLVFIVESGLFKKTVEETDFPLSKIKVYNDVAQVKALKPEASGCPYPVEVYFEDSVETFYFPPKYKKSIGDFVESVNEVLIGRRTGFSPQDIGQWGIADKLKKTNVAEAIGGVIGSAKPITANVADVVAPLIPAATAIASAKQTGATGAANVIAETIGRHLSSTNSGDKVQNCGSEIEEHGIESELEEGPSKIEENSSIDEQVDAILSLKKLLDAGILSQEEFDAKKRQLLGI